MSKDGDLRDLELVNVHVVQALQRADQLSNLAARRRVDQLLMAVDVERALRYARHVRSRAQLTLIATDERRRRTTAARRG